MSYCRRSWLVILFVVICLPGCRGFSDPTPTGEDVAKVRKQRAEIASAHIDTHREKTQLQAALNEWDRGNTAEAGRILDIVLQKNPHNRQARLLAAEIYLNEDQPAAALEYLTPLLESSQDARAEYTAGLAYDALNETELAELAISRAVALDPSNDVYLATHEMLTTLAAETEDSSRSARQSPDSVLPASSVATDSADSRNLEPSIDTLLARYEELLADGQLTEAKQLACELILRGDLDQASAERLISAAHSSAQ